MSSKPSQFPAIQLARLSTSESAATISQTLARDGALILTDVLDRSTIDDLNQQLAPLIERTQYGNDDFAGTKTQRTGALVARAPLSRALVMHPLLLQSANEFLQPWCQRILLHLTQTICIHPQQGAQVIHRDRLAWGNYLPRNIEPQFNTIWALTDFTAENGATRVVPTSNTWPDDQKAEPQQIIQAEMPAGSVLIYSGSVLHSGGENNSPAARLGLNITYCLGWLRQEENQYLSCPPLIAKDLDPDLQDLLGYTQGNYALGYYSDPESDEPGRDILAPENVLGRQHRSGKILGAPS